MNQCVYQVYIYTYITFKNKTFDLGNVKKEIAVKPVRINFNHFIFSNTSDETASPSVGVWWRLG